MAHSLFLDCRHYRLSFRHSFGIAHGIRHHTDTVYVRASFHGQHGYGEAALPPYLGYDAVELVRSFHDFFDPVLEDSAAIRKVMTRLSSPGNHLPRPLRTAVDIALHDLLGKLMGTTVRKILNLPEASYSPCSFTLGISTVGEMMDRLTDAQQNGFFKVKLGGPDDRARIEALQAADPRPFCVDANQAFQSEDEALEWMHWLRERGCLFIEQPLPVDMAGSYNRLFDRSPLPVFLDESVQDLNDLPGLSKVCHGINVKLVKCGGIEPARALIREAHRYGLQVLVGCMSESACGAMAAAQLSGWANAVDLDGPILISNDPFSGAVYSDGQLLLSNEPGTGAKLMNDDLFDGQPLTQD